MPEGLVVVGGGYAAVQIAASAREHGFDGPIRIVSDEDAAPYQRPPLSKGFLTGKVAASALPLRSEAFYRENGIELVLNTRVATVECADRRIETADGKRIAYDRLALAMGTRARSLPIPGVELDGVMAVRSRLDADRLRERLDDVMDAVVLGGGFIGLEIASVFAALGKQVTVVEMQPRLLARAVPERLSDVLAAKHAQHGVRLMLGAVASRIEGSRGRAEAVLLNDGTRLPADVVIVGVGATPNVELATSCGIDCEDGILTDEYGRTSNPAIVAAGDCARHPSAYAGRRLRLESVQNALDQAKSAGAAIAGASVPYRSVPWFWSDQYDLKLQMVGLSEGHDRCVVRGALEDGRFSFFYFRGGRLIAVDSVNRPADHMISRRLLASPAAITPEMIADQERDLRTLVNG